MYWYPFKGGGVGSYKGMGLSNSQKRQALNEYNKEQDRIKSEKRARKSKSQQDRNLSLFDSL